MPHTPRTGVAVVCSTLLVVSLLTTVAFAGTAAAQSDKADIVFVFDKTDSMGPHADALQDDIGNVADEFESKGIDARYGLVTYEEDWNTEVRQPLTSDTGALKEALDFETSGNMENASHGILTALDMEYRDDARKIVVVITNEDDDGAMENPNAKDRALQRVDDENACLVAFSPDSDRDYNDLTTYAEEVDCGHWSNFETESFTDVAAVIEEQATSDSKETTRPKRGYPNFDVVEKSLSDTTVDTDETFMAEVVVRNKGSVGGTYHALITDMDQVHYSERADIAPGETRTFRAPISYTEADRYTLRINHRFLDRVSVRERPLSSENLAVSDGTVKRSVVIPNETYEVSAAVENTGNHSGYATVGFAVGENANNTTHVAQETVYLASGETATVTHQATANPNAMGTNQTWAIGNTTLGNVSILDSNDSTTGIDAYATPETVAPNESYDVTGVVYNTGNSTRMVTVNFAPEHGRLGSLRMVSVAPGESVAVRHTTHASVLPETASIGQTNTTERANTEELSETWWVNDEPVTVTVRVGP